VNFGDVIGTSPLGSVGFNSVLRWKRRAHFQAPLWGIILAGSIDFERLVGEFSMTAQAADPAYFERRVTGEPRLRKQ
jgi:hypothetical protein